MTAVTLPSVTRGSDIEFDCTLTDEGGAVDLTGGSVAFLDVSDSLVGRITGVITNAVAGQVRVRIEGTDPLIVGTYCFRVQVLGVASSIGWPLFIVTVT